MEIMVSFPKLLVVCGVILILAGLALHVFPRTGLGHLPGDIAIKRGNVGFYFPITTCIVVSLIITFIMRFLNRR